MIMPGAMIMAASIPGGGYGVKLRRVWSRFPRRRGELQSWIENSTDESASCAMAEHIDEGA